MPDSAPARLPSFQALDEGLAAFYRQLESQPTPAVLLHLVDQLEAASQGMVAAEPRAT